MSYVRTSARIIGIGVWWVVQFVAALAMLVLFPYVVLGVTVLRTFPPHEASLQWIMQVVKGQQSWGEMTATWPQHSAAIWDGFAMAWALTGGFLVVGLGGMLLLWPFVALLECRCPHGEKEV